MNVLILDPFGAANDVGIPSLGRALEPDAVLTELINWLKCSDEIRGQVFLEKIEVIQHKPGRRCVIEYHLEVELPDGTHEKTVLIGKVRSKHKGNRAYDRLETIWNAGFQTNSPDRIMVPEPIGFFPDGGIWLQRKVPGQVSTDLLATEKGVTIVKQIAKASHKLHHANISAKRTHTMSDELRILHEKLPLVSRVEKSLSDQIDHILEASDKLGAAIPEPIPTGIHRDFYSDQVLVDGEDIYIIDFDLFCEGDPALDIGNFIGHITEQSLRTLGDPWALIDREKAMEEAFVELSGEVVRPAVKAYATLTLVRHIYISTLFKSRRPFTKDLIELCIERLGFSLR